MLSDGVQDLVADVEHDLQGRLRTVLRDVEGIIDSGDPKNSWGDIEVWLRRNVVAAAVANYDTLAERTTDLATDVSERFSLDAGGPIMLDAGVAARRRRRGESGFGGEPFGARRQVRAR